jgi:hypothetical protein
MIWVLVIGGAWLTLATAAALLIARAIRIADAREGCGYREEAAAYPASPASPDNGAGGRPPVRHATADPAIPRPRPGHHDRLGHPRHSTHVNAVRDPLNAAERVPPTRSGTA